MISVDCRLVIAGVLMADRSGFNSSSLLLFGNLTVPKLILLVSGSGDYRLQSSPVRIVELSLGVEIFRSSFSVGLGDVRGLLPHSEDVRSS